MKIITKMEQRLGTRHRSRCHQLKHHLIGSQGHGVSMIEITGLVQVVRARRPFDRVMGHGVSMAVAKAWYTSSQSLSSIRLRPIS